MLRGRQQHALWQIGPFLSTGDSGGTGDPPADDSDLDGIDGLGDAGKAAIKAERAARRKADGDLKALNASLATMQDTLKSLQDEKAKRDADALKAAESEREQRGEFESLAKTREQERDSAKAELAALTERFAALNSAMQAVVKADFDTLPEEIREVYTGAADDPVAILAFVPKGKALAAKMQGGSENNSQEIEGAKPNPKPAGNTAGERTESDKQAAERFATSYM